MHSALLVIDAIRKVHDQPLFDAIIVAFFVLTFVLPTSWGLFRLARGAVRRHRLRHNFPT
jgi:hypothetical protein